ADPADAGKDQVDAEENAEHIEAGDRPVRKDDDAEQQRDHPRQDDPHPRHSFLHAERQDDPHDAADNQRDAENEGQDRRREQRIFKGGDPGHDVDYAEQKPKHELAPALDLERIDDLGYSRENHHDPDYEHAGDSRHGDAAERNHSGDQVYDAESNDPAGFGAERRDSGWGGISDAG